MNKKPILKLFYDVETTGVNWRNCSIHQFSALIEVDGVVVETIDLRMRPHPDAQISAEAMTVGGVTVEQIQSYPDFKEQFLILKQTLKKYVDIFDKTNKFFMIGFKNASFDDDFLKKLFDLCGDSFWLYFYPSSIDVSCLAAEYLQEQRGEMPSFKLSRVAKTLGLYVDGSRLHDSLYDCELTRQVYRIVTGREEEGLV